MHNATAFDDDAKIIQLPTSVACGCHDRLDEMACDLDIMRFVDEGYTQIVKGKYYVVCQNLEKYTENKNQITAAIRITLQQSNDWFHSLLVMIRTVVLLW